MTIHLDTSLLIDALCAPFRSLDALETVTRAGERTEVSSIVLFEWLRGRRLDYELSAQEQFVPSADAIRFDAAAAAIAAGLYKSVKRPRRREIDIVIAACAIERGAALWTLNPADFADVPGLTLFRA